MNNTNKNSQLHSEPNASQAFIEVTDAQSNMGDIDQDKPVVNGQPNGNNTSENFITPQKKRRRPSVCGTHSTRKSLIEQEALLRIQKLKRSMEHDEELHLIKKQAAEAEKLYWETKLKKLNQ
ncbi:unnamed protein product [Acanthoscelides obtectus]|uniref:Uncharacterized protein n=1 Tax=Acanthoscelides obtectus TaxID=200917 RepID=A0A9P0MFY9_ACAOB|nr:unnamed protein product [Acanthoscelides obtectus]CAK1657514.1 hypothetical protein AOBTE_LOCUS20383 [Acanthoscelides obtectus]